MEVPLQYDSCCPAFLSSGLLSRLFCPQLWRNRLVQGFVWGLQSKDTQCCLKDCHHWCSLLEMICDFYPHHPTDQALWR